MKAAIEMNELIEQELSIEELEMVSGGNEEEDGIIHLIIHVLTEWLAHVFVPHETFDEFYSWVKNHEWLVISVLAANTFGLGLTYKLFPEKTKIDIMRVVYIYLYHK